ncbi:MAG: glycosyltransferase family 2 protein [Candidatus Caccovivens sp.]
MSNWDIINLILSIFVGLLMIYQIIYIIVGLFAKRKFPEAKEEHCFGILIAGRNEENVIGQLLESINKQNYDTSKLKIFVCADNCSENDKTAEIAKSLGAVVYERHDTTKVGKSYALNFLFENITKDFPDYVPDGYFVFDADNILDKNYIKEMNKAFDSGEEIITSYRASKNYDQSIMSMGSSIAFIRECRFVHSSREFFKISTHVSGTGFLFSSKVLKTSDGWKYGRLTEDLEFSCDNLIKGHRVGYCDDAIFYDEQPVTFEQTYKQRMRWQKGTYQCFSAFALNLFCKTMTTFNFAFYDFFMFFFPLPVISTSWSLLNGAVAIIKSCVAILGGAPLLTVLFSLALSLLKFASILYIGLFLYGSLAVLKDWKRIKASTGKKIASMFAYPLFMIALIPICFIAIFKKVEWKPIKHSASTQVDDLIVPEKSE